MMQLGPEVFLALASVEEYSTWGWIRSLHSPSQVGYDRCAERWGEREGKSQWSQGPPNAGGGVVVTGWLGEISSSE
jgi:hypothetical protein